MKAHNAFLTARAEIARNFDRALSRLIRNTATPSALLALPRRVALSGSAQASFKILVEAFLIQEMSECLSLGTEWSIRNDLLLDAARLTYGNKTAVKLTWDDWQAPIWELQYEAERAGNEEQARLCRESWRNRHALIACLKALAPKYDGAAA